MRALPIAAAITLAAPLTAAANGLSATASTAGFGLELASTGQSATLENGAGASEEIGADFDWRGLHAYMQRGPTFRAEVTAASGTIDGSSDSTTRIEARNTLGYAAGPETRLYAGLGIHQVSEDGGYERDSVYLPVGFASSGELTDNWRAMTTLEFQMFVSGSEEVDIPNGGTAEFERTGGWGAEVAVQFEHTNHPLGFEPFVSWANPGDTESETVGANEVRIVDFNRETVGIRGLWRF